LAVTVSSAEEEEDDDEEEDNREERGALCPFDTKKKNSLSLSLGTTKMNEKTKSIDRRKRRRQTHRNNSPTAR